jgi:hypothetical protein
VQVSAPKNTRVVSASSTNVISGTLCSAGVAVTRTGPIAALSQGASSVTEVKPCRRAASASPRSTSIGTLLSG